MRFWEHMFAENSEISCMRVMSFLSLLIGATIAYYSLFKGRDLAEAAPTIGVFVGAAFGGKVTQKFAEMKGGSNDK